VVGGHDDEHARTEAVEERQKRSDLRVEAKKVIAHFWSLRAIAVTDEIRGGKTHREQVSAWRRSSGLAHSGRHFRKARTPAAKHRAVADSLEEAGDRLFTFTRLPPSQWRSARTTNAIERLHEEFKRRIKTQTVLPSADTAAMLFWALLASVDDSVIVRSVLGRIGPKVDDLDPAVLGSVQIC
jgi:Transposase, Mutator family